MAQLEIPPHLPAFDSLEAERLHRKQRLAAGFRLFGKFGFDACIDYKAAGWQDALKAATPNGVDRLFENVGGEIFDLIVGRMNPMGRIAVCGLISGYNGKPAALTNVRSILTNKLMIQGFIISDHLELWAQAHRELADLVVAGKLKYRESITEGIENAPRTFLGLLKGENFGKTVMKL